MSFNCKTPLYILVAAFLLFASLSWAEQPGLSAKQFVEQQFAQVKQTKSLLPLFKYVDWETAFRGSSDNFRATFGFESAAEMKTQYHLLATSPAGFAKNIIEAAKKTLRQSGLSEEEISRQIVNTPYTVETMSENYGKIVEELIAVDYVIGKEEQKGDSTQVWISFTFRGNPSSFPLKLQRRDGQWYLTEVPLLDIEE